MQSLASELLFVLDAVKGFSFNHIAWLSVWFWMAALHWLCYAEIPTDIIFDKNQIWEEVQDLNISSFTPEPTIVLYPHYASMEDIPKDLRTEKDYEIVKEIWKIKESEGAEQAYLKGSDFLKNRPKSALAEWISFFNADWLFQVQSDREDGKLNLALEEYTSSLRQYPLHPFAARVLYQMMLLQLKMELYPEVQDTVQRALNEQGKSEYAPLYHLLLGEQAFRSGNDVLAMAEFRLIVEKYPKSSAAVDAAFRQAYLYFRRGDFKAALRTYTNLEQFHSEVVESLRLTSEPSAEDKFIDRVYYAETIFLNQQWEEASRLIQTLANIFPTNSLAPFLWVRFADTYARRGRFRAAIELYQDIRRKYDFQPLAVAMANIHLADIYFLTDDVRASKQNENLYQEAFELGRKANNEMVASSALAKLGAYYWTLKIFPKAQRTFEQYKNLFSDSLNQEWIAKHYIKTLEIEILDYCDREDYMAALATFLTNERTQLQSFTDTKVLLRLADSAKRLALYETSSRILNRVVYLEKTSEGRQEALLKLVDLLILQNELRKASERLRRFNFAYPKTPLKYLYETAWGNLYYKMGNLIKASTYYEQAIEAARLNPENLYQIRQIYLRMGEAAQSSHSSMKAIDALDRYVRLIEEARSNPLLDRKVTSQDQYHLKVSRFKIADLYYEMKDYVRALEAYRTITKENKEEPFLSYAKYRMGECYLALQDRKAALEIFSQISSKDPDNLWVKASQSYIKSVEMEVKYGIRIFN